MKLIEGLLWLAINIHNEAHHEPLKAKIAVAHVTLNRAKKLENVHEVVTKPYQFSWTWFHKGKPSKKLINEANKIVSNWTIPKKMHSDFFVALLSLVIKDKNNWTHYRRWDTWNASWTCKNWEIPDPKSAHVFCKQKDVIKNKSKNWGKNENENQNAGITVNNFIIRVCNS